MEKATDTNRRKFLTLLAASAPCLFFAESSWAKDGESGGGDSGGSDSGGSDSSSDSNESNDDDNSGSGGDTSGSSDSGSGNSGSGNSGSGGNSGDDENDHDDARNAVRNGDVLPLSKAMSLLRKSGQGRVIEVKLSKRGSSFEYRFKVIAVTGKVKTVRMDAATGRLRGS